MVHFENDSDAIPDGESSTEYETNRKGEKKADEERRTFLFLLVKNNIQKVSSRTKNEHLASTESVDQKKKYIFFPLIQQFDNITLHLLLLLNHGRLR